LIRNARKVWWFARSLTPTSPPVFNGDQNAQNEFLVKLGATWPQAWTLADTIANHEAWHHYVTAKRTGKVPK
jgi:hypothetical protein